MKIRTKFIWSLLLYTIIVASVTAIVIVINLEINSFDNSYKRKNDYNVFLNTLQTTNTRLQMSLIHSDEIVYTKIIEQQKKLIDQIVKTEEEQNKQNNVIILLKVKQIHTEYAQVAKNVLSEFDKSFGLTLITQKFEKINLKIFEIIKNDDDDYIKNTHFLIDLSEVLISYEYLYALLLLVFFAILFFDLYSTFLLPVSQIINSMEQMNPKDWYGTMKIINNLHQSIYKKSVKEIKLFINIFYELINKMKDDNQKLTDALIIDSKTTLYNFRYFKGMLANEVLRSQRFNIPFTVLMIDIDYFKYYNDTIGHLEGDMVLIEIAEIIKREVRETDISARFGGDEFIILLPNTVKKDSLILAERLRMQILQSEFKDEKELPNKKITISVGIASFPDDAADTELIIRCADIALYEAKRTGKNKVVLYDMNIMKKK